jgi:hypothetical protein
MTDRLQEIEQRLERITNGEWLATCDPEAGKYSWTVATFGNSNIDGNVYEIVAKGPRASELIGDAKSDAEFAASAPTDIAYLLGEVKRLHALNEAQDVEIEELIDTRDRDEDYVTKLAIELGCREEWSNLHSHWDCVLEKVAAQKPETL